MSNYRDYETIGLVVLVLSSVILVILNFTVGFFWAQINVAIAIIDCAADFLNVTKRIFFLSFLYFLVLCSFTISLISSVFVLSSGHY